MPKHLRELTDRVGDFYCPRSDSHVTFHRKGRTTACTIVHEGFCAVGLATRHFKDKDNPKLAEVRALEDAVMDFGKPVRTELFKTYWVYRDMSERVGVAEAA